MSNSKPPIYVLAVNSGSSSLKFGLYRLAELTTDLIISGEVETICSAESHLSLRDARGNVIISKNAYVPDVTDAMLWVTTSMKSLGTPEPEAIGHRIVHGGPGIFKHCIINDQVREELKAASAFAPLHIPTSLAIIGFMTKRFPGLPQVACLDTAFHQTMPDVARVLPIPRTLREEGIQRYGFHGLSCESIITQLAGDMTDRMIIAHLGSGASITAVRNGRSIDTSMGLTPTGGVLMGTRSGDLDPGLLIYLLREKRFDHAALEALVDQHSGLLGISGLSNDLRNLRNKAAGMPDVRLAIQMFCMSVRKQIAGMISVLDGVDTLIFTGGIGENDWETRAEICRGLSWSGVVLNASHNETGASEISAADSRCSIRIIPCGEDAQIAHHTRALVSRRQNVGH